MLIAIGSLLFQEAAPFMKCHSKWRRHKPIDGGVAPSGSFIHCKYRKKEEIWIEGRRRDAHMWFLRPLKTSLKDIDQERG